MVIGSVLVRFKLSNQKIEVSLQSEYFIFPRVDSGGENHLRQIKCSRKRKNYIKSFRTQ